MLEKGPKELQGTSQLTQKTGIRGCWDHWESLGLLRVGWIFPGLFHPGPGSLWFGAERKDSGRVPGKWEQLENLGISDFLGMSAVHPPGVWGAAPQKKRKIIRIFIWEGMKAQRCHLMSHGELPAPEGIVAPGGNCGSWNSFTFPN